MVMQDDSAKKRSRKLTEKDLYLKKSTLRTKGNKMNSRLMRWASVTENLM